jgi:hypothetical protein
MQAQRRSWLSSEAGRERPLADVPLAVRAAAGGLLVAQLILRGWQPAPAASAEALQELPATPVLRAASLGDPIPLAQMLALYLQAFDNQPGISIPFLQLDYGRVEAWLEAALELDPAGQYPLLMAAQVYGQVPDPARQRRMLALVYRHFQADPDRRWRWLAHAAIMARHRLQDRQLALQYARALREQATGPQVPSWARQMEIFLYEDAGEHAAAKALLGGLLHSGAVTDAHELRFLTERLSALGAAENSTTTSKRRLPAGPPPGSVEHHQSIDP